MTKSIQQSRRELFEAWYVADALKNSGFSIPPGEVQRRRCVNGDYADYPGMHGKWLGFNGALDALVITLPETFVYWCQSICEDSDPVMDAEEVRAAIESLSLGVKIND